MVGVNGIGGVSEPQPERPAKVREDRQKTADASTLKAKDGVLISNEAQAAAKLARAIQVANEQTDVRTDRVAQARERLARGDYKNPEVVAKVAERISRYLP